MKQTGGDTLVVTGESVRCELQLSQPEAFRAVFSLASHREIPEDAPDPLTRASDPEVYAQWIYAIAMLHDAAALEYVAGEALVVPHSSRWPHTTGGTSATLSRFARMRLQGDMMIVESPVALAHVELPPDRVLENRDALGPAGLLSDFDAAFDGWSESDAWVHAESRLIGPRKLTERSNSERIPLQPAVSEWISLGPNPAAVSAATLDDVLRTRRSIRANGETPITAAQLAELLARSSWEVTRERPDGKPAIGRAYASGGNCHSLDLYVAVAVCDGIDAGLYLYNRASNAIGLVSDAATARTLVRDARRAAYETDDGQVLLILASDFATVMSRYTGIAYSLILKEAGAAIHTIHLVASAMNLAACPIGTGDSSLFSKAVGATPFEYTSVGEILLGSVQKNSPTA